MKMMEITLQFNSILRTMSVIIQLMIKAITIAITFYKLKVANLLIAVF